MINLMRFAKHKPMINTYPLYINPQVERGKRKKSYYDTLLSTHLNVTIVVPSPS